MTSLLDRQRERFLANPDDGQAFAAIEEELHLAGQWDVLIEAYLSRVGSDALADSPAERAQLQLRMGQVHQDRRNDPDRALECYREALLLDSSCRPAMLRMRRVHTAKGQWEIALQIAEVEVALPQRSAERARVLSDIGTIWLDHLEDPNEALGYFSRALAEHSADLDALEGSARAFEAEGHPEQAANAWDRAIELLSGPARAAALVCRARLTSGPLQEPEQATDLYRRALTDEPGNREALEAVVAQAKLDQHWMLLTDLQERRFELETGVAQRTQIAIETGRLQLDELGNPSAARLWFERAAELDPQDPVTCEVLADLARDRGDDDALLRSLERAAELWTGTPPIWMLMELAALHSDKGDSDRAIERLELAFETAPDDSLVAEALCEVLSLLGRDEQLIEVLEQRATLAGPDDELRAITLAELGSVFEERLADTSAATDAFERAFEAEPGCPSVASTLERLYRKTENWQSLRSLLERAADVAVPGDRIAQLCKLAAVLSEHLDERAEAVRVLEQVLEIEPETTAAHRGLQHLAAESGDGDAQLRAFEREAQIATDPSRLAELVAELVPRFEARDDLESALAWVEKWISAEPETANAHSECARLHERLGHDAELAAALERLDGHLSDIDRVANRRRLAGVHMRFDRTDAAIEAYQSALELDPLDVVTLEPLAVALARAGRIDELANTKRQIAGLASFTARIKCLDELSRLVADRLGDVDAAIDILIQLRREVTDADCGSNDAVDLSDLDDRLEDYLVRSARHEERVSQLAKRAASLDPSDPESVALTLRRAGVLFDDLARFDAAAAAYRSAYDRDGHSDLAREGLERSLRASGNSSELAEFLGEQMELAGCPPETRDQCAFERAVLLEETLDREPESLELYRSLASSSEDACLRKRAADRLEEQLERNEEWELLRTHLEASLGDDSDGDCRIHERLGSIYRERLRNWPRAIDQFDAAATIAPERADLWRILASLYEQQGQIDNLVSALEAEIATGPDCDRELTLRSRAAELCIHPLKDPDRAQEHFEQILVLDQTHSAASDFLLDYWEHKGNASEVVALLEARLIALEQPSDDSGESSRLRASLRLRIAGLQATVLDDLDGAIGALEATLAELGPEPFIAEPLADLYQRDGRTEELVELCVKATALCRDGDERACWFARQGAALRRVGRERDASQAYRNALTERPDDRDVQAELCDLYRQLEDHEPLVRLLELELSRLAGDDEIPVRIELANLLEANPTRQGEALIHLKRVLDLRSDHGEALDLALSLAERLHDETGRKTTVDSSVAELHAESLLELLEAALRRPNPPLQRAAHLARRARLSAQVFDRAEAAIADYRETLTLDPQADVIGELRAVLAGLGRWDQVLDCVFKQTRNAGLAERIELFEDAIDIAWNRLSPESALPWLERLRCERPHDPAIVRRIAEVHRLAGHREATLHTLECELALIDDPKRQLELHRERARILQDELGNPARAVTALEDAELVAPGDPAVLQALCALYQKLGRPRQQARALEAWIESITDTSQRIAALRDLADLFSGPLASPRQASTQLWKAVALAPTGTALHGEMLRELGHALRAAGDAEAWARCAEQELLILDREKDVFAERRVELHRELARTYEQKLGRPDTALEHLIALVDSGASTDFDRAETSETSTLLRLLRVQGNWIELETRLAAHLVRNPNDPPGWLELAQLRDERMRWTGPAAEAYRQVLAHEPGNVAALRGLRSTAARQGNWSEVARALEDELEHVADASGPSRARIQRRLGDLYWHRLESTTRASRWYASALESNPDDFESLRSLQQLLEAMEDWRGVLDLYDSEIEMLGDTEPARRAEISIRSARQASERTQEIDRAIRGYEYAARISPLESVDLRSLAELYESTGNQEAFADTLETWCDREDAGATALDHLKLATMLHELGRNTEALERIESVVARDPELAPAWDLTARLREQEGDDDGAGEALTIAAELGDDQEACARLIRAALLYWDDNPSIAAARLRTAIHCDPGSVEAHARLALLALQLGGFGQAELAAGRALDLATTGGLDANLHLQTAMAGGRAGIALGHLQSAVRCFSIAVEIAPENPQALAEYGEALAEQGDTGRAREVLEARLGQDGPNDERSLHLTLIARAHWQANDLEAAQQSFEAALAENAHFDPAHESLVAMWKREDRLDLGIVCLERWADAAANPIERAERLLQAAEWELDANDPNESAEQHLREVLDTNPSELRPWEALTTLLWDRGRGEDALQVASLAMNGVEGAQSSPTLSLIQGRALEQIGEREEAAAAFHAAAIADPRCVEAALSRARLLRALGDWQAAAETLREFSNHHVGEDHEGLSEILQQLGRLFAGPLEDADSAIAVYRRAIALNPDRLVMHAALAEFLSHRPADWREALAHHQWVLNEDPTHRSSLRVLMRISRDDDSRETIALGIGIAKALGQASPADLETDFTDTPACFSGQLKLANPLWETVRGVVVEAAGEIATSLGASNRAQGPAPDDTVAAFHAAAVAAEGKLSAAALLPLTDREFGDLVQIVCALSLDVDQIRGDGRLVNALSSALTRRTRRRLRKILDGVSMESIAGIDFRGWRSAVRAMAQSVAIDETRIEFGDALVSVARQSPGDFTRDATASADLAPLIAHSREAGALLRRAIGTWLSRLRTEIEPHRS